MIDNKKVLKKFILRGLRKIIRLFFDFLPITINRFFAQKGYTYLISRKKNYNYLAKIYSTNYKIIANPIYPVERVATSNKYINDEYVYSYSDPIKGIYYLKLKNWTMIDIGANVGTYSLASVNAGATKIFAIEPGPFFSRLCDNIKLNKLNHKIIPFNLGLSEKEGIMKWIEEENNLGNAHLVNSINELNFSKIQTKLKKEYINVNVSTLPIFIEEQNIKKIDLIKIDVEGMEWKIIKSSLDIIEKFKPIILVETHRSTSDILGYDCITPIFDSLYKKNYKSYTFENEKMIEFIYPNFSTDTFFIKD